MSLLVQIVYLGLLEEEEEEGLEDDHHHHYDEFCLNAERMLAEFLLRVPF
ncbi:hypothetical protein A2U01_0059275, partial [Trifolium medium]|nr:hypothetical protein [Trifolium medium]